jgi:hypothetical protein
MKEAHMRTSKLRRHARMVFTMWVSPAHRQEVLYVQEAQVVWANSHEYGLELRHVSAHDRRWLTSFFREYGASADFPAHRFPVSHRRDSRSAADAASEGLMK